MIRKLKSRKIICEMWFVAMNHQHTPKKCKRQRNIEQSTGKYAMITHNHIWYSMFTSSCLPVTFEMPDSKIRLSYFIHNRCLVLHIRTARVCVHRLVCYFIRSHSILSSVSLSRSPLRSYLIQRRRQQSPHCQCSS